MPWRDDLRIDEAANLFPMMPEGDLIALGEDIKRNGMKSPIAIRIEKGKSILLDGRNRLDAMERVGLRVSLKKNSVRWDLVTEEKEPASAAKQPPLPPSLAAAIEVAKPVTVVVITTDPIEFITSANIHRRHLLPGDKRNLIAALLREKPERSDRATAELAKVDHKTVATVRRREEDVGRIPHVAKVVDTRGRHQPTSKPKTVIREPTAGGGRASTKTAVESYCAAFRALESASHEVRGDDWRQVVNELGEDQISRHVSTLKSALDDYGIRPQRSAVKSAADRAEARAKS
jgi:hypothetical protein